MSAFLTGALVLGTSFVAGIQPDLDAEVVDLAALHRAGLTQYWEARLPVSREDSVDQAFFVDDALYITTDGGMAFALTADAGLIRWGAKLTEADYSIYRPIHVQTCGADYVIVPTTPGLEILNRYSGETVRTLTTDFAAGGAAAGIGNWLFMGSSDGHFYCIAWYLRTSMPDLTRWSVRAGGPITAAPVLYDGDKLLFASQSGTVYSCFAADKAYLWSFRTDGAILGDPAIDDSGVYVASGDRSLYKLDRNAGLPLWRFRAPSPLRHGPALTSHTIYQRCPGYGLIAVDTYTGREKWRAEHGRTFVAHTEGRAAVLTADHDLQLIDQESGEVQQTLDTVGVACAVTNVRDEAIYLLGLNGRAVCLRPAGVAHLRPEQVTAARNRLNVPPTAAGTLERLVEEPAGDVDPLGNDPLRSRRDLGGP